MNFEEYKKRRSEIESELEAERKRRMNELCVEYLSGNESEIKVGDVICAFGDRMRVDSIKYGWYRDSSFEAYPVYVYKGVQVTKVGGVAKKQRTNSVSEPLVDEVNGKPYKPMRKRGDEGGFPCSVVRGVRTVDRM